MAKGDKGGDPLTVEGPGKVVRRAVGIGVEGVCADRMREEAGGHRPLACAAVSPPNLAARPIADKQVAAVFSDGLRLIAEPFAGHERRLEHVSRTQFLAVKFIEPSGRPFPDQSFAHVVDGTVELDRAWFRHHRLIRIAPVGITGAGTAAPVGSVEDQHVTVVRGGKDATVVLCKDVGEAPLNDGDDLALSAGDWARRNLVVLLHKRVRRGDKLIATFCGNGSKGAGFGIEAKLLTRYIIKHDQGAISCEGVAITACGRDKRQAFYREFASGLRPAVQSAGFGVAIALPCCHVRIKNDSGGGSLGPGNRSDNTPISWKGFHKTLVSLLINAVHCIGSIPFHGHKVRTLKIDFNHLLRPLAIFRSN